MHALETNGNAQKVRIVSHRCRNPTLRGQSACFLQAREHLQPSKRFSTQASVVGRATVASSTSGKVPFAEKCNVCFTSLLTSCKHLKPAPQLLQPREISRDLVPNLRWAPVARTMETTAGQRTRSEHRLIVAKTSVNA